MTRPTFDPPPPYPPAPRGADADTFFGVEVPDPFRVLEDPEDPATRAWAAAQDGLFRAHARTWPGREALRVRIAELTAVGQVGPPVWRGDRCFFRRRLPEQEHAVLLTVDPDGTERVLIDPVALDAAGTTTLDGWRPSTEGDLLAYLVSRGGTEESELYVMDVSTGEVVDGPVDRVRHSPLVWLPGGRQLYYVRTLAPDQVPDGEVQYHRRVRLHTVGTDPEADPEVLGAGLDPTTYFDLRVSHEGRWLAVSASQGTAHRNNVLVADLAGGDPAAPVWRVVQEASQDAWTDAAVARDGLMYLLTDVKAPRGRLCVVDPAGADIGPSGWRELVPEDPGAVLEDWALLDDPVGSAEVLVVARTRHAVGELAAYDARTGADRGPLPLPGGPAGAPGSIGGLVQRPEGGSAVWFGWSDHRTPSSVWSYDAGTGRLDRWAAAPGSARVPDVHVALEEYGSKDGTTVRMFVVSPVASPDRPRPTVLYGYGGFSIPMAPAYSAGMLAWAEAGGVYAVACLRGGTEEGQEWHRAGMRGAKQNVFDDLHAAADHLVARGWTDHDRLGISGGSNGGLLVGAALTQSPRRYAAVVCSAPLLDMLRYERHGLGRLWTREYGSVAVEEEFGWLYGYSPYHRVRAGVEYPAVLFTVFDGDTRVDPLHARKMCAALQEATASHLPVLLRTEGQVGHGDRSVTRSVDLSADTLAFLAHRTGLAIDGASGPGR